MNRIEQLVNTFKEVCETKAIAFGDSKIIEIATNCISLSETWFENFKSDESVSYALEMYNSEGNLADTAYGITRENLPNSMMSIIANNDENHYSKVALIAYRFDENGRRVVNVLGELEIS